MMFMEQGEYSRAIIEFQEAIEQAEIKIKYAEAKGAREHKIEADQGPYRSANNEVIKEKATKD